MPHLLGTPPDKKYPASYPHRVSVVTYYLTISYVIWVQLSKVTNLLL